MMIIILLSSCNTATSATPELKLGVYKSGNGLVNAYGEKLYIQRPSQKTKRSSPSTLVSLSTYTGKPVTAFTLLAKHLSSDTGYCGEEAAPYDKAFQIRDVANETGSSRCARSREYGLSTGARLFFVLV